MMLTIHTLFNDPNIVNAVIQRVLKTRKDTIYWQQYLGFRRTTTRVFKDYSGVITVTGMVYDSDVKIVDTAGHLIYQGTSLGGQFTWDGRNKQGRRVATGIYMVLAADSEGKEGIVTKIAFIRGE